MHSFSHHKINQVLLVLILGFSLSSCAVLQDKLASKRYKQAVADRDRLSQEKLQLIADTTRRGQSYRELAQEQARLSKQYKGLDAQHSQLYKDYKDLLNSSTSKADQLNAALRNKQQELERKELNLQEKERMLSQMNLKIQRQDSISTALNKLVKNALLGFSSEELSVEQRGGKVYVSMSDKLLFKSGSAAVETKGQEALKKLGEVLARQSDIDILIEGHTDNVPIRTSVYKDNWDLSVVRATSIVRLLSEQYKITPTRMTASGKGEYFPVASNETSEGRARNRRTEIILSPRLDDLYKLIQTSSL